MYTIDQLKKAARLALNVGMSVRQEQLAGRESRSGQEVLDAKLDEWVTQNPPSKHMRPATIADIISLDAQVYVPNSFGNLPAVAYGYYKNEQGIYVHCKCGDKHGAFAIGHVFVLDVPKDPTTKLPVKWYVGPYRVVESGSCFAVGTVGQHQVATCGSRISASFLAKAPEMFDALRSLLFGEPSDVKTSNAIKLVREVAAIGYEAKDFQSGGS